MLARAVFDVGVEVDADPLEEAVVEANEADFDRDLQILQPAQLLQQVGDLFVDGLRLADDQAEVRGEGADFGLAAAVFGPGFRGHRRDDQVDQRVEVGVGAAAHAARPAADRHRAGRRSGGTHGRAKLLGQHVRRSVPRRRRRADRRCCTNTAGPGTPNPLGP